jgi:hypothetical protein
LPKSYPSTGRTQNLSLTPFSIHFTAFNGFFEELVVAKGFPMIELVEEEAGLK